MQTLPPEVTPLVDRVHDGAVAILGDGFSGMIVHGSLALGEFNSLTSDIDLVVVTDGPLSPDCIAQLAQMHAALRAEGLHWPQGYECSYIPQAALRRYDPDDVDYPALDVDGNFRLSRHGPDWVLQRHIIREHGLALSGPPPASFVDPVPMADRQWAARTTLAEWWTGRLAETAWLADPVYPPYAVLTMCRALYTVTTGDIAPKPVAGRWALTTLPQSWHALVQQALDWRPAQPPLPADDVLAFIRYTLKTTGATA